MVRLGTNVTNSSARHARHAREDHAGSDIHVAETAAHPADQGQRKIEYSLCDPSLGVPPLLLKISMAQSKTGTETVFRGEMPCLLHRSDGAVNPAVQCGVRAHVRD